jgi:hypothetical protein
MAATILPVMPGRRRHAPFNPGFWLCLLAAAVLAATFVIPWWLARRTARVEDRADRLALLLLEAAVAQQPFAFDDPSTTAVTWARFLRSAAARGIPTGDLELAPPPADRALALIATNRHYVFQLAATPRSPDDGPGTGIQAGLEVLAWPREREGPAHVVLFHAETGESAHTRNLQIGYVGVEGSRRPEPGCAFRRAGAGDVPMMSYRGLDDERWILHRGDPHQ